MRVTRYPYPGAPNSPKEVLFLYLRPQSRYCLHTPTSRVTEKPLHIQKGSTQRVLVNEGPSKLEGSEILNGPKGSPYPVDSKKLEYGPGTIFVGFPSSLRFGLGGQLYSNFLASTVQNPGLSSSGSWALWVYWKVQESLRNV